MTNKELLERCAKVMGIKVEWNGETETFERPVPFRNYLNWEPWSPLTSVADAAEMAIKLKVDVIFSQVNQCVIAKSYDKEDAQTGTEIVYFKDHPTEQAAYCWAIVQVVAQMGGE